MFILIDFDRTWPENPGLSNPEEELHNAFVPIFDAWELFWWGFCRGTATGRPSISRPSFWWVMYQSHPISSLQAPPQWKKFSSGTVWLVASFFFPSFPVWMWGKHMLQSLQIWYSHISPWAPNAGKAVYCRTNFVEKTTGQQRGCFQSQVRGTKKHSDCNHVAFWG